MDYVDRFKYDGYCVIPNIISDTESDDYIDTVKNVIQRNTPIKDYKGRDNRLYNLSELEPSFSSLYNNETLVSLAKEILGCESIDVWRDRLYPCETIMHPPVQNSNTAKCSPNKTLTCYLCLVSAEGMSVQHESHLEMKPFPHEHQNSIEGEGTIHPINCKLTELTGNLCAVFTHMNTIVEGKNPIEMTGTWSPKVVWEYVDTESKNVFSHDKIDHGRITL
tara:strand:- start:298 stop:960 length:663 start_codon:yes stop_codon:yes gene_type:complete